MMRSKRSLTDLWFAASAASTVGMFSLVLEDGVQAGWEGFSANFLGARLLLLMLFLLVTWWSLSVRRRLDRSAGTLYYVRALSPGQRDRHGSASRSEYVQESHLDMRTLQRRLPRFNSTGVDVSAFVADLGRDLEMTMNEDSAVSGFQLAVNTLWPAAVALGYDLDTWDNMQLLELNDGRAQQHWRVRRSPHPLVSFKIDLSNRCSRKPDRISSNKAAAVDVLKTDYLIAVELSGTFDNEDCLAPIAGRSISGREDLSFRASPEKSVCNLCGRVSHGGYTLGNDNKADELDPVAAGRRLALEIVDSLHRLPDSRIHIAARIPKSVAVYVGWLIGDRSRMDIDAHNVKTNCFDRCCQNPWERLVLWHWQPGGFMPMRVHPDQISLEEQWKAMAKVGASLNGSSGKEGPHPMTPPRLVNCTPHQLDLYVDGELVASWPRSTGPMPRAEEDLGETEHVTLHPDTAAAGNAGAMYNIVGHRYTGETKNLPGPRAGVLHIVSKITAAAAAHREDLIFPIEHRDADGRIIGCSGFGRFRHEE